MRGSFEESGWQRNERREITSRKSRGDFFKFGTFLKKVRVRNDCDKGILSGENLV